MAELIRLNFSTRNRHIETQKGLYRRFTSTPAASTKRQGGCRNRRKIPSPPPPLSPPFMLRVGSWIRLPGHLSSGFIQPPAFFQLHPEICASRISPSSTLHHIWQRSTHFQHSRPLWRFTFSPALRKLGVQANSDLLTKILRDLTQIQAEAVMPPETQNWKKDDVLITGGSSRQGEQVGTFSSARELPLREKV